MKKKLKNDFASTQESKKLYNLAAKFKKIAPWNWMNDTNIFATENPADGQTGYCCVCGAEEIQFGLTVYLGREGLQTYFDIIDGKAENNPEIFYKMDCIMLSFVHRRNIPQDQVNHFKKLGLEFNDINSWPLFERYIPGYAPWKLTKKETLFMTCIIEQAINVSNRISKNPQLLFSPETDSFFTRVPEKNKNSVLWKDEFCKPAPVTIQTPCKPEFSEKLLDTAKEKCNFIKGDWEVGAFYFPNPVAEKGKRPYFPFALLCVDAASGQITNCSLFKTSKNAQELSNEFLKMIIKKQEIPKNILIISDEHKRLLAPVCEALNIGCFSREFLPLFNMAKEELC